MMNMDEKFTLQNQHNTTEHNTMEPISNRATHL